MKTVWTILKALVGFLPALITYLSGHQKREAQSWEDAYESEVRRRKLESEVHRQQLDAILQAHAEEAHRVREQLRNVEAERDALRAKLIQSGSGADAIDSLRGAP